MYRADAAPFLANSEISSEGACARLVAEREATGRWVQMAAETSRETLQDRVTRRMGQRRDATGLANEIGHDRLLATIPRPVAASARPRPAASRLPLAPR